MSSDDDQYENNYDGVNQDFDDSEDDMEYQMPGKNGFRGNNNEESDDDDELEDGGDDDEEEGGKITAWGSQKKRFYKEGDDNMSNDDAEEEEEEEARLIEKLQNEQLNQEDFFEVFGDQGAVAKGKKDEEEDEEAPVVSLKDRLKAMENLTEGEKLALIKKESPELMNIINELKTSLKEVKYKFEPLLSYFKNRKGENKDGQRYIELKFNLLMSYCMSLSYYILLNTQGKSVQDHPVIKKLISIKTSLGRLKPLDKKLQPEINQLLKNIEKGKHLEPENGKKPKNLLDIKNKKASQKAEQNLFNEGLTKGKNKKGLENEKKVKENEKAKDKKNKKIEAVQKVEKKTQPKDILGKRNRNELQKVPREFDDEIEDDDDDDNGDLYGGFGDDDDDDNGGLYGGLGDDDDFGMDEDDGEDDYYKKVKAVKKVKREKISNEKQTKNAEDFVPKASHYVGEEDIRGINRKILKNKGLTRKRPKKNRNSRVKLRQQYEKAQQKRISKGQFVREKQDIYQGERVIRKGKVASTKY